MHCSANVGDEGDTAIFLVYLEQENNALLQTQKKLIDDEHGWTNENTVFNFEGGCYAKVINLEESEPDISEPKKVSNLENVVLNKDSNQVDFEDTSITPNTRVSYPIYHIDNIQPGSIGKNLKTYSSSNGRFF
jgi:phosphoenolpyruvate carboxykinase (ATP)